ncbi:MAG: SUMF1/EgtB/PvdO family nonheme iron enzyme [Chitinivibrionales bacterium]|nr:SUMF1/EgtB/PvdO family nonheme iron enzyme [Chitinivibrionales bacterium]
MKCLYPIMTMVVMIVLIMCSQKTTTVQDTETEKPVLSPQTPDSIWIDAVTYTSFRAVWTHVDSVDGYRLIRTNGAGAEIDTVNTTDTVHTYAVVNSCNTYIVKVFSHKGSLFCSTARTSEAVSIFRFSNPRNVRVDSTTATSATIRFSPTEDQFQTNHFYRLYVRTHDNTLIDSVDLDSAARGVIVTGLQPNRAYKMSLVSATARGPSPVDSNCLYDTSSSLCNTKRFPYVFVSTYETPSAPSDTNLAPIPGGICLMGYVWERDVIQYLQTGPLHEVIISPFYMSKYETTAQQYAQFLMAKKSHLSIDKCIILGSDTLCDTSYSFWPLTYDGTTIAPKNGKQRYPMQGLTWFGAIAYCNWLSAQNGLDSCYTSQKICDYAKNGYRLPTEAEFEYVASAAVKGHKFRFNWGSDWDTTKGAVSTVEGPAAVGRYAGYLGVYDLTGNIMEWVNDWSDAVNENTESSLYYQQCLAQGVVTDPRGPALQIDDYKHMMRGGSYETGGKGNLSTYRYINPCNTLSDYGFRVCRSAQ